IDEGLALARAIGDDRVSAALLLQRASLGTDVLAPEAELRGAMEEALATYRAAGDPGGEAAALAGLGRLALDRGDPARARPLLERALALPGSQLHVAQACCWLARALAALGDRSSARRLFERSLAIAARQRCPGLTPPALDGLAALAAAEGRAQAATR